MKTIAIFYGSTTGCTKSVAETIRKKLTGNVVHLFNVSKAKAEDIDNYNNLILGTSTWGMGDLQDDWDTFLPIFTKANLSGKTIALFGLGDGESYPDTFVDGMGTIYEALENKDYKIIGKTEPAGYSFSGSKALRDNIFVGLPLDDANQSNLTTTRIDAWLKNILTDFQ